MSAQPADAPKLTHESFTAGPWIAETSGGRGTLCVLSADAWICGELHNSNDMPQSESQANARLIAAAPDLLVALQKCVAEFAVYADEEDGDNGSYGALICEARAAIAKATGAS